MNTYQALYYPFIHFKDDAWLKLAALYWDKVARIVPYDYVTDDSDTVKALGPITETLRPDWVRPEFGRAFVDFVTQYAPKLREKYALALIDQWPELPRAQRPPKAGGASGDDLRLGYIYYEKIDNDLYMALKESGLASTDARGEHWIGMHPRLAWVYMTAMAEQLSGERGLRPLTDETRDHVAISSLAPERLAQVLLDDVQIVSAGASANEIESVLISVAFKAVVPLNPQQLDVQKILAFRDKYPEERAAFQEAATELLSNPGWLKSINDPKVLEERLRDEYDKSWAQRLKSLQDKLNDVGIDTVLGCFNAKANLPNAFAGAAAALALPLNPIAAGAAGIALGLIPTLRDKRKGAQDALKSSPVAYLYRMEQELAPKELWSWVKQRSLHFALGV